MTLRLVFMGTPAFAVPTLAALVGQGHEVIAAYTQPPRMAGRGMDERRSPVHEKAQAFGIPVRTPASLRDPAEQAAFAGLGCDVAVVVAYGQILPRAVLEAPRLGCYNLHASLLPRWRGAAPIQRAIMAGDRETGVMLMRMAEGLDTGPICLGETVPISAQDTAGALHDRLATLGADLAVRGLAALERDALHCTPQPEEGVTYAAKISKSEARIDWTEPAAAVLNRIRGLAPSPGAWCEMLLGSKPERIRVLRAALAEDSGKPGAVLALAPLTIACGDGSLRLLDLQRAGKKPVPAEEFLRGARLEPGALLR